MAKEPALTALRKTTYLGSHPAVAGQVEQLDVVFQRTGVAFVAKRREMGSIPWDRVIAIEADSRDDIERRITGPRVLALGFWALVAKKETRISYLVLTDDRGEWVFAVPGISAIELRSGLVQLQRFVPASKELSAAALPSAPAVEVAVADRLRNLKTLLSEDLITQAEYEVRRQHILEGL